MFNFRKIFFLIITLAVIFFAAHFLKSEQEETVVPEEIQEQEEEQEEVDNTLYNSEYKIHLIKIDPNDFEINLKYDSDNPKVISSWIEEEKLAINGGYFHEDYSPSGYLVSDGQRIGSRLFDQEKSGVMGMKDGKFFIRDLSVEPLTSGEKFDWAIQSYPFLIKNSEPAVLTDSGLKARRSAVGIDSSGFVYFILADSVNISLYEFSQVLDELDIDFVAVLNLDGGPSSGMISNLAGQEVREDSLAPVPSVILVD